MPCDPFWEWDGESRVPSKQEMPWNVREGETQPCRGRKEGFKEVASSSQCFQGQVYEFHSALFNDLHIPLSILCVLT